MSPAEQKFVDRMLRSIYGTWHACRLRPEEEKGMRLKPGTLCDNCEGYIKAWKADLAEVSKEKK